MALLDGPAFTFTCLNEAFRALTPGRALLGRPLAEAWPELAGPLPPPPPERRRPRGRLAPGAPPC